MKDLKLIDIVGVGPVKAQSLQNAGFHTVQDIADADTAVLQAIPGFKTYVIEMIMKSAAQLLESGNEKPSQVVVMSDKLPEKAKKKPRNDQGKTAQLDSADQAAKEQPKTQGRDKKKSASGKKSKEKRMTKKVDEKEKDEKAKKKADKKGADKKKADKKKADKKGSDKKADKKKADKKGSDKKADKKKADKKADKKKADKKADKKKADKKADKKKADKKPKKKK